MSLHETSYSVSFRQGVPRVHGDSSPLSAKEHGMSETFPSDRTDDVEDEVRETGDDVSREADRAKDELAEGADSVKDGIGAAADKVSDTVEDMIPGDSDRDGH